MTKIEGRLLIALAAVLIHLMLAGTGVAEVVDRIVAEVNNDIITLSELQNMAKTVETQAGVKPKGLEEKKMQREMLEALIDRKLAKAEAKRRGIVVADKEVNEAMARFKQQNNISDDETFAKGLAQAGLSLKEFKQQLADQMTQERLLVVVVGTKVSVSDTEVRRLYDQQYKKGGTQVHIVTLRMPFPPGATEAQKEEIKQKAETILNAVKRGESLTEAAGKFSLRPSDVGFVAQSDLEPRLAEYLGNLKPKEVAPVLTQEGIQLMQVVGRRSGEARPFEEAAPQIRRILQQQKMEKHFAEWVKTLREKAHVKIML
ncbi:MAG: SurA N-terminal domain-containing protein [Desulfobacterales bacterium]|nr:SurA N-terminal domain-containing protein [Pseudomonadota bacterium]MBU4356579.1 SurA N-terminal domain-containing protein [Pseudomonadota bacterium]MCG2771604.1 SurA N-terminal domain-containing protein [Desulfobacterales bacterium]